MSKAVEKATAISNARIQFVSLVDAAANRRRFLIAKNEENRAKFSTYGRIIKTDENNHYITGIVYEPMVEDSQGDYMTEQEITKAAYYFVKNGNKIDIQHSFEAIDGANVVESWIAKADFSIGGEEVKSGTWLMTVEVTDPEVWRHIEKGEISGFSMGGVGEYSEEDVDLDTVTKIDEKTEKVSLLAKIAKYLGIAEDSEEEINKSEETVTQTAEEPVSLPETVEKAGKAMSSKNLEKLRGIRESIDTFLKAFEPEDEEEKTEEENAKETGNGSNGAGTDEEEKTGSETEDEEKEKNIKKLPVYY